MDEKNERSQERRKRLHGPEAFAPWVRAEESAGCSLFWMPVSGFPVRAQEKIWLLDFFDRFAFALAAKHQLRQELFLEYKLIGEAISEPFLKYAQRSTKLMGVGRYADNPLPPMPTVEQVRDAVKSGKEVETSGWFADFVVWFTRKEPAKQRELFLGHGGMMTLFLAADPKAAAMQISLTPKLRSALPVFQRLDVEELVASSTAARDGFLMRSKELLGKGLEDRPEFPGLAFVLPLLNSGHFFQASPELKDAWFSLFEIYIHESLHDKGLVLAFSKEMYEGVLLETLEAMRREGSV